MGRPDFAYFCGKMLYFSGFWPKIGAPQKQPFLPPPIPQLTPSEFSGNDPVKNCRNYRSLGNGVRKSGVRNWRPYGQCGVDTEIPYRLPFSREFCLFLPVCVACGVDTEFPYRVRIVDRGVDCRDPVCRHRFRFLEGSNSQQVLNPTPLNPTPATRHMRKQKLRCSFRNAALQKLHCNIGFSAVRKSFGPEAVLQQTKNCNCNIEKAALQESGAFLPLSCGSQAPTFRHPRLGSAEIH